MDTKEAYIEKAREQMTEIEARIIVLQAQAEKAAEDTKIEIEKRLEELDAHRKVAEARLQKLQQVSGDAWKDLREGMEKTLGELKEAAIRAKSRFD